MLKMKIEDAVAKIRALPVADEDADRGIGAWAGLVPVRQVVGAPEASDWLDADIPLGTDLAEYRAGRTLDEIVSATSRSA